MGRPLNKRYFGNEEGSIAVTAYKVGSADPVVGSDAYIVRQRSTNRFVIETGSDTAPNLQTLKLVDKATRDLEAGEFRVEAVDDEGNIRNVRKFYSHKVVMGPVAGATSGEEAEVVREDVEFRRVQHEIAPGTTITISATNGSIASATLASALSRNDVFTFGSITLATTASADESRRSGRLYNKRVTVSGTTSTTVNFNGLPSETGSRNTGTIVISPTVAAELFVEGSGDRAAVDSQES